MLAVRFRGGPFARRTSRGADRSQDTAMTEHMNEQEIDPRSASEKQVDEILGASGTTKLDKQFGRILKVANDLFISGKQTRKYLLLGEECDLYVRKAVDMGVK